MLQPFRRRESAQTLRPSGCDSNSRHRRRECVSESNQRRHLHYPWLFPSWDSITASAFFGGAGANQRNNNVAAAAPISCAMMKPCASIGLMPTNVSLAERSRATAGLAKEDEVVSQ